MELILTGVPGGQADRLRSGELSTDDLVTPSEASYSGEGDVTYLGCGCFLSMIAALIGVSAGGLLGYRGMLTAFLICEAAALWIAWEFYRLTHPRPRLESIDARLLIPEDARMGLTLWHGIHYLLTGTAWDSSPPLCFLLHGGAELRWGAYGAERLLAPEEVASVWNAISSIGAEDLLSRYNAESMNRLKIYPLCWDSESERARLAGEFEELKRFLRRAAETESAVVLSLG